MRNRTTRIDERCDRMSDDCDDDKVRGVLMMGEEEMEALLESAQPRGNMVA